MSFGSTRKFFSYGAELQDYVLAKSVPGTLTVVPHQRLAHQIWHRQRLEMVSARYPAWEPLTLRTLQAWWFDLFQELWSTEALAPPLVRLALWRQALKAAPPPIGPTSELAWAQALDESHILLCRHGLGPKMADGDARTTAYDHKDAPLVGWRRRVTKLYTDLLRQANWLSPGELPAYLLVVLRQGRLKLPARVLVACLETPAPLEELWLKEISPSTELVHLQVRGNQQNIREAVILPDPGQEMDWVAAQLVKCAQAGEPLHGLAITAMDMESYAPHLRRILAEIMGPAESAGGWSYNFSRGPSLSEAPLFLAGLLPLYFIGGREHREDLISLLLSPYYQLQINGQPLARWDRAFREQNCDQGWDRLRQIATQSLRSEDETGVLARLDRVWSSLKVSSAPAVQWCRQLRAVWQDLGFPHGLSEADSEAWARFLELLGEVENALGPEVITAADFLEWLKIGAHRIILSGPGIQAAGVQVLGLLEMRGLNFSRVFCLGMNSGTLPAPPRPLPMLSAAEKRQVLGGTYQSQHYFAAELFSGLLGSAPHLTLTRPNMVEQEERVCTPLYLGEWEPAEMAVLASPHPAWLRSAAIRAAFQAPASPGPPEFADYPLILPLPGVLSLSQVSTALGCPCRFLLEHILKIKELPEVGAGLDPRERGQLLHAVLARFVADFGRILEENQVWDHERGRKMLKDAGHMVLAPCAYDLHWQAEADRWFGEGGLLWEWLRLERERFEHGWRWLEVEAAFHELCGQDWPFSVAGRIDRLDYHPASGALVVWDYKSGEIPKKQRVLEDLEEPQLACYLLAVEHGRLPVHPEAETLRAGFIGLKSPRSHHLKHEDFNATPEKWQAAASAFAERVAALGRRLSAGDFRPDPTPAPAGKNQGVCLHCAYGLICGFMPEGALETEGDSR